MRRHWCTFAWLAAAFGCGMIGGAAWAILAAAWGLTSTRIEAMSPVVDKYAAVVGRVSAWALFSGFAFAGNSVACVAAFLGGKALAVMVA